MIPSYEDICSAFTRIRKAGGSSWDYEHELRRFELAAQEADVRRSCERLAAYRLAGEAPPLGYYDAEIDRLFRAIELLVAERSIDHGDVPHCLAPGAERSKTLAGNRGVPMSEVSLEVSP